MTAVGTVGNMPIPIIANGSGTAQAGAASSLTLNTLASAISDVYKHMQFHILSGTGAGQERNVVSSRQNLLKYSQTFDNAWWVKTSLGSGSIPVVTPNYALAPDGTMTADRVVMALNGGNTTGSRSWLTTSDVYNCSAGVFLSIWLKTTGGGNSTINITGGDVSVTGTWQRFALSPSASAGINMRLGLLGGSGTSDSADILYWGAQLEAGSVATEYIQTLANAAVGVAVDVPFNPLPDATSFYELYIAGKTPVGALTQPTFIVGTVGP